MHYQPAEIEKYPGYHFRRLQQMAVAVFMEEAQPYGLTPVQYAALSAVLRFPGLDQRGLARCIGFDTSTIGSVIDRLEARRLVLRGISPLDKRVRLLTLTAEGAALLEAAEPAVLRAQDRMLAPLPEAQRAPFMAMMAQLINAHEGVARAPCDVLPPSVSTGAEGADVAA